MLSQQAWGMVRQCILRKVNSPRIGADERAAPEAERIGQAYPQQKREWLRHSKAGLE